LVLYFLDTTALGVFNQIYAIYVIAGQIFVWGFNDSALKHVSEYSDSKQLNTICATAIVCGLISGSLGAILLLVLSTPIGRIFDSQNVLLGIRYLSPGILFFVVNKVFLWIFNGKRKMKNFALASAIRATNILVFCIVLISTNSPYYYFGLVFTVSEILLFIYLVFAKPTAFSVNKIMFKPWMLKHFHFGSKVVTHGLLTEAFIRIDIIMLGIFLSDKMVGIYSFAAFFIEGIYQIPVVVRNLNNPILVKLLLAKDRLKLVRFNRSTALLSVGLTLIMSLLVGVIFPFLDIIFNPNIISESYAVLLVLLAGMIVYSLFIPFDNIFLNGGFPGIQSLFMISNASVNVILNIILIPKYGLMGACFATVSSFIFASIFLNILSAKYYKLSRGLFIT
jgi:O-antigen/teichoic acid export membrane protein